MTSLHFARPSSKPRWALLVALGAGSFVPLRAAAADAAPAATEASSSVGVKVETAGDVPVDEAALRAAVAAELGLIAAPSNQRASTWGPRMALNLNVNGATHSVDVDPQTPLLWVIRDSLGLTGTKFSCGIAQCGACTLHVDGQPVRSCSFPVSLAVGKTIKTIEGVSPDGNHPIQRAWKELDAPQCGYCQSGMIMSALALLERNGAPTDADIDAAVTNACRCSSYHRVRKAIHLAADLMKA